MAKVSFDRIYGVSFIIHNSDLVIFIIPVSCLIILIGIGVQSFIYRRDPKITGQSGDSWQSNVILRSIHEFLLIIEIIMTCSGKLFMTTVRVHVQY